METDPLPSTTHAETPASRVKGVFSARVDGGASISHRGGAAGVIQRRGSTPSQVTPHAPGVERPAATLIPRQGTRTLDIVAHAASAASAAIAAAKQDSFRRTLRKIVIWGVVGSVAVHLLLGALSAVVIGQRVVLVVVDAAEPEPEVRLVFPEAPKPEDERKEKERYIQTAQNNAAENAPEKPDFISDKNTVASAKEAPDAGGDPTLPSMKGTDGAGLELAESSMQDGEIRKDATRTPPPATAAPSPPPAPPKQEIAKKEETTIERIMRELESATTPLDQPAKAPEPQPMLAQNDPPAPQPTPPSANAAPALQEAYMPETKMRTVKGGVAQRGDENAVNAAKTIAGAYYKQVHDTIGQRWNREVNNRNVQLLPGRLVLRFFIAKDGSVRQQDISIAVDEAGPVLKETAYSAIFHTKLPPIPADMAPVLVNDRFEMVVNFVYQ